LERVTWIVIVGTATLGIPSLILEHTFQLDRDRQAATLEFAKIFQSPQLVEKRLALLAPWLDGDYDVRRLRKLRVSTADVRAIVLNMVDASNPSSADVRSAIFDLVDFYETLQLCVERKQCDQDMASAYFQPYAWEFYCLYRPYINQLRTALSPSEAVDGPTSKQSVRYGDRLETFATASPLKPCYQ
jgi:hypothetical protein